MAPARDTPDGRRPDDDHTARSNEATGTADHPLETVKHSIEQVADKVKALLRSDR